MGLDTVGMFINYVLVDELLDTGIRKIEKSNLDKSEKERAKVLLTNLLKGNIL